LGKHVPSSFSMDRTLRIVSNQVPLDSPLPVVVPGWDCAASAKFFCQAGSRNWNHPHSVGRRLHRNFASQGRTSVWEECRPRSPSENVRPLRRNVRKSGWTQLTSLPPDLNPEAAENVGEPETSWCAERGTPPGTPETQAVPIEANENPASTSPHCCGNPNPHHCRPLFPPWYCFGVFEFAPVGFPTFWCGGRVQLCGSCMVLGQAEK
jgi:hypothetical protein